MYILQSIAVRRGSDVVIQQRINLLLRAIVVPGSLARGEKGLAMGGSGGHISQNTK
jgi:hypothetical protein